MADISKINPNGTEYNLKDATARAGIESSKTLKSSVVTVNDAAPINAEDITVDITPQQDLHGFDKPWAGGAWKNKLEQVLADLKANNTSGTWSGNMYAVNGGTVEVLVDSADNVLGFKANGTFTATSTFNITVSKALSANSYILNGCPSGGSNSTYKIDIPNASFVTDYGNGVSFTADGTTKYSARIVLYSGNISDKTFYPMIRLATETDPTFAPYSNECPIEGRTGAELDRVGKNLIGIRGGWNGGTLEPNANAIRSDKIAVNVGDTFIARKKMQFSKNWSTILALKFDADGNYLGSQAILNNSDVIGAAFNVPQGTAYIAFSVYLDATDFANVDSFEVQVEKGSTVTTYEPYQGKQYTASFGETVYGGKHHVTAGGTDKTHANIASYNGEAINEPWLSSMDEYVAGATPTTGAQVVYPLSTPTTINTPAQAVPMLQGINTVYADCGDTSLKYQPDNVIGELKGEIRSVEVELAEAEENLEIVYEDHVANTSMGIIVDGYSVGDMPFSNALDIAKPGYTPIAVTDTSIVHSTVANQGEIATHCLLDVTNNRVRFYVHVMDSAASLTIPPNSLTFRVAYKKA